MAEKEFARAKDHILNGDTKAAKKILKKIIRKYPKTTYAEQAKTLLNGLPD
jgi:TolA-binding protein